MNRYFPWILIGLGLIVIIAGFFYDLMFAGIPYQDPSPEQSARYAAHARIAKLIILSGAGVFFVGCVTWFIRFFITIIFRK